VQVVFYYNSPGFAMIIFRKDSAS